MNRHLFVALLSLCAAGTAIAANVTVTSTTDVSDGATSSIAALIASPGSDGVISLREAMTAANTAGQDSIRFAIPGAGVHDHAHISAAHDHRSGCD